MALTPEQLAEIQRLKALMQQPATDAQRRAQAIWNAEQMAKPQGKKDGGLQKFLSESKIKERLYHATPKDFKEFKLGGDDPTLSGPAVWLSADPHHQPAMHNISGGKSAKFREGVNVMPVHVQSKNPMILDDKDMIEWARAAFANGSREFPELLSPETVKAIKEEGYDSIVHADPYKTGRAHEIIMLHPNKIKSAIGNRGTYDTKENDITKANGGSMDMDAMRLALMPKAKQYGNAITHAHHLEIEERPL